MKDTVFKDDTIFQIFTGNPKDERTKQREDMDPAILRELTGVEVPYMPSGEMFDIIRAKLIEENGVLKLSESELKYIKRLTKAAEMMQRIHNRDFEGFPDDMKGLLGIDPQGNTQTTLNKNFLDSGTLMRLFSEWELAHARGQKFEEYMVAKLNEFIRDPKTLGAPEERETLQKILDQFALITVPKSAEIAKPEDHKKGYILPSEMPVEKVLKNPMGGNEGGAGGAEGDKARVELKKSEEKFWSEWFRAPVEVPPVPDVLTPELIERFKGDPGFVGIRAFPKLDIGTVEELRAKGPDAFLAQIHARYPGLHVYETLTEGQKLHHPIPRLPVLKYWQNVEDGRIPFPEEYSKGGWLLMEVMPKPPSGTNYEKTDIYASQAIRYNFQQPIIVQSLLGTKRSILTYLGLPASCEVRLPKTGELNMFFNRTGFGATNTGEWTDDPYSQGGACTGHVTAGNSEYGGASNVGNIDNSIGSGIIGYRIVVDLCPASGNPAPAPDGGIPPSPGNNPPTPAGFSGLSPEQQAQPDAWEAYMQRVNKNEPENNKNNIIDTTILKYDPKNKNKTNP